MTSSLCTSVSLSGVAAAVGGEHLPHGGLGSEPGLRQRSAWGASPRPLTPLSLSHARRLALLSVLHPGQVLNELDLDNDNMLSFSEFEHAMAKAPDFMK